MLITLKHKKVVEKFMKKVNGEKHSFIELVYMICCRCTYVTENDETYFKIYTYQESCPLVLPLLNTSSCQSVLKYLSQFEKLLVST